VITYTYDPLNRLTGAAYSDDTFFAYQYDAVGNRETMTTAEGIVYYTYDAANRLTSVGGETYTWDNRGNLTHDGTFTYTYDAAGRLVGAQSITNTLVYTYDGDGVRMAQEVDGVETRWVQDTVGLAQVLMETSGGAETIYLYGHARLAQVEGASTEWFLGDALGSVRQVVDDGGEVVLARDYAPFGVVLSENGTGGSGYGFTGEQYDGYTQFVYLRARWMDPVSGRFISQDSWEGSIQQPSSLHKYLYVSGNPVNLVDPGGQNGCAPGVPCLSPGSGGLGRFKLEDYGVTELSHPGELHRAFFEGYNPFRDPQYVIGETRIYHPIFSEYYLWALDTGGWLPMPADHRYNVSMYWAYVQTGDLGDEGDLRYIVIGVCTDPQFMAAVAGTLAETLGSGESGVEVFWSGKPHNPRGGHWSALEEKAKEMLDSGKYERIYINKAVSTATGRSVPDLRRPDIIGVKPDGSYHLVEVVSQTQTDVEMIQKLEDIQSAFGDLTTTYDVIVPKIR
jgi:RHS repeat-associated protein